MYHKCFFQTQLVYFMQRCQTRKSLSLLLPCEDTIPTEDFGFQIPHCNYIVFLSLIIRLNNLQSRFVRRNGRKFQLVIYREKFLEQQMSNWNITVTLTSDHYRRSALVQRGMEIACKVKALIPGTCINFLLKIRYKKLTEDTYTEPQNKEILGCYLNQPEGEEHSEPRQRTKKKVLKRKEVATEDIRNFLAPAFTVSSNKKQCK